MNPLTKDQILAMQDAQVVPVTIPEWGGIVYVRSMSAGERDRFEAAVRGNLFQDIRAKICAWVACDCDGKPLFTSSDIPALTQKSAAALDRIFETATKLNRFSRNDVAELEGNSETGQPVC